MENGLSQCLFHDSRTFGLVLLAIEGLRLVSRLDLHISWNATKPGIGIVVAVERVAAIFALVDVCSSIGVAFTISDLLRSRRR